MDGARERKEGLSERREAGAGREGATERIEEQGRSEGSEQGRQGYFGGGLGITSEKIVNWYINSVL